MSRTGRLLAALLLTIGCHPARGQSPASLADLSPVERQQADFYGAIAGDGAAVKATWTLGSRTVILGSDIELTLRVEHAVNHGELLRPNLSERPEWKAIFSEVGDVPAATPGEFRYRLKPRNVGEFELPLPRYRYYHPRAPEGKRMRAAFSEAVKLTVTAPVEPPRIRIPLEGPSHFFDEDPSPRGSGSPSPPSAYWWTLFILALLGTPTAVALWRRWNPDAARLAHIRRAKSVRTALDALLKAEGSPDFAERVARAMLRYLAERWNLPASARTPREVMAALDDGGQPPEMGMEAESLLGRCDAARFGDAGDTALSLPGDAARLIGRWEGM